MTTRPEGRYRLSDGRVMTAMSPVEAHHWQHGQCGNGRSPWLLAWYPDIDDLLAALIG